MTEQAINIAVAKEMSFYVHFEGKVPYISTHATPVWENRSATLPDFCNDLNAMRRAVMSLSTSQYKEGGFMITERVRYMQHLERIVYRDTQVTECNFELYTSTAHQQAEAFLRVKGKWV